MKGGENSGSRQRGLGKGLAVLLGEASDQQPLNNMTETNQKLVQIEQIGTSKIQPRKIFNDNEIDSLASSVKIQGILQPILIRPVKPEESSYKYEIVAGERRWRAAQKAGLHEVPVIIRELDDETSLGIALVENLQRQNLEPLEEADGFFRLANEFNQSHDQIGSTIGKSRSYVSNTMRLLGLSKNIKLLLNEKKISAGHARALLGAKDPDQIAAMIISRGLSVRQTEKLIRKSLNHDNGTNPIVNSGIDPNTRSLERELSSHIGLNVIIKQIGDGGSLTVRYNSLEQLEDLLRRLR